MTLALVLAAFLLPAKPHWVRVKAAYVHMRWLGGYGNVLGEYYEVEPGRFQAQCYAGDPVVRSTEYAAKAFVLRCEVW